MSKTLKVIEIKFQSFNSSIQGYIQNPDKIEDGAFCKNVQHLKKLHLSC